MSDPMTFDVFQDGAPQGPPPIDISGIFDEPLPESHHAKSQMTPEVAEQMLRKNMMSENQINAIIGKQSVSWGDKPPIMHPSEELIALVKFCIKEKQDAN